MTQTVLAQTVTAQTIPQPVTDRIESEWRQMREISAQIKPAPISKKQ